MSSLVIDLCSDDDDDDNNNNNNINRSSSSSTTATTTKSLIMAPPSPSPYRPNKQFKATVAKFFKDYPISKNSEKDAELNDLLVANCNTLTNMKKNIFPDINSFIDAAGLRVEESLDGFFAKSGACQFASIAFGLYPGKQFEEKFRPDQILREIAVNVIAANQTEYHQYLEPAVVHLRTRSTRKSGGHSINIKQYLKNMTKAEVDGDS